MQQIPRARQGQFGRLTEALGPSYTLHTPEALRDAMRRGTEAVFHPCFASPFYLTLPINVQPKTIAGLRLEALPQPLSARKPEGLELLIEKIIGSLPEGPRYFPEDQVTDQPMRFMVGEVIREQVLQETSEEVPYATTVLVEQFEEGAKLTRIAAAIYCEREGQKRILIGKQAQMLKKIGTAARLQIEKMVGTRVFLELFVKVSPEWRESQRFIEELDWRRQLELLTHFEKT